MARSGNHGTWTRESHRSVLTGALLATVRCRWEGWGDPSTPTPEITSGVSAGMDQATTPPNPWPTTAASAVPRDRITAATSPARTGMSYRPGGLSAAAYPRRSRAATRSPEPATPVLGRG